MSRSRNKKTSVPIEQPISNSAPSGSSGSSSLIASSSDGLQLAQFTLVYPSGTLAIMALSRNYPELNLGESLWSQSARVSAPLFRWAGGKQRFLWDHRHKLPHFQGRYFEPFAGGLSVYFHYVRTSPKPFHAVIGDVNLRLIRCYKEVYSDPDGVADRLASLNAGYAAADDKPAFYYDVREQHNLVSPRADAARFIFLMAAGWNGVYRTNQKGGFNVPHGAPKALKVPSLEELTAVATVFSMADIRARSWEATINTARRGDFVFLDPPYASSRGDLYERSNQFTTADQVKLAGTLVELQERGVDFLLTNSADEPTRSLYTDLGLNVTVIEALRSISGATEARTVDTEIIVTPNHRATERRQENLLSELKLRSLKRGGNKNGN